MSINSYDFFCKNIEKQKLERIQEDLKYGLEMEKAVCPILEQYFHDSLTKTSQYHCSDWFGDLGTFYELKSRKDIEPATYATTIFPCYKCKIGENNQLILVFHFSLNNETYYIEYNKELFSRFQTKWVEACRNSNTAILHYEIPIGQLKQII